MKLHLRRETDGRVTLWGGPIEVAADGFVDDEQFAFMSPVPAHRRVPADEGERWKNWSFFSGVQVVSVVRRGDYAQLKLPKGSWLLFYSEGLSLALEAEAFGLPVSDETERSGLRIFEQFAALSLVKEGGPLVQ